MSTPLPIAYQTSYRDFQKTLEYLRDSTANATLTPADLEAEAEQVQIGFQTQILSLDLDELEPAIAHHVQAYQVEMHKQLRLLATDLSFLQAARKPATLEQRRSQVGDRAKTLIRYCKAVLGDSPDPDTIAASQPT